MYHKIALKLTDLFVRKKHIDAQKRDIYTYGFEMLLSTVVYMIIFVLIAVVTGTIFESLLFWLGLFLVRKIAGGHHSDSYTSCHLLFAANHLLFILLLWFYPADFYYLTVCIMTAFSILSILLFAPVDHKNKPFIKNEFRRYRFYSKIYCGIFTVIFIFLLCNMLKPNTLVFGYSFGAFSATISLLIAKIIRHIERRKNA